jgi:hypothetical protein
LGLSPPWSGGAREVITAASKLAIAQSLNRLRVFISTFLRILGFVASNHSTRRQTVTTRFFGDQPSRLNLALLCPWMHRSR